MALSDYESTAPAKLGKVDTIIQNSPDGATLEGWLRDPSISPERIERWLKSCSEDEGRTDLNVASGALRRWRKDNL